MIHIDYSDQIESYNKRIIDFIKGQWLIYFFVFILGVGITTKTTIILILILVFVNYLEGLVRCKYYLFRVIEHQYTFEFFFIEKDTKRSIEISKEELSIKLYYVWYTYRTPRSYILIKKGKELVLKQYEDTGWTYDKMKEFKNQVLNAINEK